MHPEIEAMLEKWTQAYGRRDAAELAALYTDDAIFFGGSGGMRRGQSGAQDYFSGMTWGQSRSMVFRDLVIQVLAEGVVSVGMVGSAVLDDGPARDVRFTQIHVRTPQGWRIASHHGSGKP